MQKGFLLRQKLIYLFQFFGGEGLVVAGAEVGFQLGYGAGADDYRCHSFVAKQPSQRHLCQRLSTLCSYLMKCLQLMYQFVGEHLGAEEMQAENVLFENAPHKDFSFAHKINTERPSGTPDERTLILNGKTYSGQYSRTYETALAASEFFESYGRFHTYRSDTVSMDFRASTGELMLFTNFDEAARTARGDLTEREAKEITDALLRSLYGEEAAAEYPHDTTLFTDSELGVFYSVVYRKQVWGMPTKDAIQISVNMQGEILGINAKYLGLYSLAETRLTEKNISDALAVLKSAFSQNWSILDTKLVMDAEGEYFLSALLAKSTPQGTDAIEVYISVLS